MSETARLRLPEIAASQSQKHVTHNEALVALDTLLQISVIDKDLDTPPGSPAEGDCYIVASGGTGDWTGWDDRIARYEDGAWRSYLPGAGDGEGWLAYVQDEETFYVLKDTGWAIVAALGAGDKVFNSGSSTPLTLEMEDDGAGGGPHLTVHRQSASPAANDTLGGLLSTGRDSAGNLTTYAAIIPQLIDPTNGAERGRLRFFTANSGALSIRGYFQEGMVVGTPTGGDKGIGAINAKAVYDDNTLLTCMALQDDFLTTGRIDTGTWDARVPDLEVPEQVEEVAVLEEVEISVPRHREEADGSLTQIREQQTVQRAVIEPVPVYDEAGNGIDMVERAVTETRVTPARTIPRRHEVAHLFKRMLDDGFDPRDPAQYIARLRADKALPGMPTQAEWRHNSLSVGEMMSRKWLALELLALVVVDLAGSLASQDARLATLEKSRRS